MGTIRQDCRFDLLVEVAHFTANEAVRYVVVGDGPLASKLADAAKEVRGLTVMPRVPRKEALSYVLASDLTWAVYQNRIESMNPRMTLPWKLFESVACGVPVLVESGTFRTTLLDASNAGSY